MTYNEFVAELDRAALTIRAFAKLVGMQPNSISNYASHGEVPKHLALIAALLSELKQHGIPYGPALTRVGPVAKPKRTRIVSERQDENFQNQIGLGQ